jgi:hypothetical protein
VFLSLRIWVDKMQDYLELGVCIQMKNRIVNISETEPLS